MAGKVVAQRATRPTSKLAAQDKSEKGAGLPGRLLFFIYQQGFELLKVFRVAVFANQLPWHLGINEDDRLQGELKLSKMSNHGGNVINSVNLQGGR